MKDWKMIVISATLAFILSFIFGLLGSVSSGILLIRALSGAIIFGAMGFGVAILLRRYLPELYELKTDSVPEIDEAPIEMKSEYSISDSKPQIDISIDDDDDDSFAVEMKPGKSAGSVVSSEEGNDLVDEISESEDTVSSFEENDKGPANIDVLPDMGVFSNSFEGEVDGDVNGTSEAGALTLDIMGEEQDPELVVRAVRTMVKKDQEG